MIHTALSPNAEKDDIFLAYRTLLTPWTWRRPETVFAVEKMLGEVISVPNVVAVDSGRTALWTILRALGIGVGHEVIVQAYTCVAVPDPVLWAGARPVYVDCTDDLTMNVEDLKKKITPQTKAIVVQHTFGMPARIDEIIVLARDKNILVIEDCAHSLGGESNGRMLGSIGDISFFSFGRDKSISSVFGGAIAVRSPETFKKIQAVVSTYPLPGFFWVTRQLKHPIILSIAKATYNFLALGKIILEVGKRLHLISKTVQKTELSGGKPSFVGHRFSPALAVLAANQLRKLPRFTAHREALARHYATSLAGKGVIAPAYIDDHAYLRYTIFAKNSENQKEIFQKAKQKEIHLGDWYTTVLAPRGVDYKKVGYTLGSCPNAERLASMSVNLPTHIGITSDMAQEIIDTVFG